MLPYQATPCAIEEDTGHLEQQKKKSVPPARIELAPFQFRREL